jgi:DNA-binding LacI/PurR family transcriptional regulator
MARALAHLMVRRAQSDAPDGLVIADDNLLEYATAGIVDAGVRVPADLEVVAHCNFPWPTPSSLPVRRLGYDVRELLQDCLMSIDEQRQGLAAVERTVQVKFEDELTLGPASTMPGFSGVGGESAAFAGESSR